MQHIISYTYYLCPEQYDVIGLFLPGERDDWGGWGTGAKDMGNCWRYACNDKCNTGNKENPKVDPPGRFPQTDPDEAAFTCDSIKNGVLSKYGRDGVDVVPKSKDCDKCKYKVLLVIRPKTLYGPYRIATHADNFTLGWDYHFYRQDTDANCNPTGTWSHKGGGGPLVIGVTDPESDASNNMYKPCEFYFCLPCKSKESEAAIDVDR